MPACPELVEWVGLKFSMYGNSTGKSDSGTGYQPASLREALLAGQPVAHWTEFLIFNFEFSFEIGNFKFEIPIPFNNSLASFVENQDLPVL